jgi:hypothetical protein
MSLKREGLQLNENEILFLNSLNQALITSTYTWSPEPADSMFGSLIDQLGGQDDESSLIEIPGFNKKKEFFNAITSSISPKADQKILIDNLMALHLLSKMQGHEMSATYPQILSKICMTYNAFHTRSYREKLYDIRCAQKFIELLGTETTIEAFIEALETAEI